MFSNLLTNDEIERLQERTEISQIGLDCLCRDEGFLLPASLVRRVLDFRPEGMQERRHEWSDFHYSNASGDLPVCVLARVCGAGHFNGAPQPNIVVLHADHGRFQGDWGLLVDQACGLHQFDHSDAQFDGHSTIPSSLIERYVAGETGPKPVLKDLSRIICG